MVQPGGSAEVFILFACSWLHPNARMNNNIVKNILMISCRTSATTGEQGLRTSLKEV